MSRHSETNDSDSFIQNFDFMTFDKSRKKKKYYPERNLMLVKVSHVNDAMVDFKTELYDVNDGRECHFVRILRIGPDVQDAAAVPGSLAIVHKSAGKYLDHLSQKFREEYYIIKEEDILGYSNM